MTTRLVALAVLASGCATAPHIVQSPDTATLVKMDARAVRGTIGPDAAAWFSVDVELDCASVTLEASTKSTKSILSLVVRGPDGSTHDELGTGHVAHQIRGPVRGHYLFELTGPEEATYRTVLRRSTTGFECGDLPPDAPRAMVRVPAATMPATPAGFVLAPIVGWDVYRAPSSDRDYLVAHLAKGYADGVEPTPTARLVDASGAELPDITVDVRDKLAATGGTRAQIATAVAVLVPLPAHKAAPIQARVVDRWREGNAVFAIVESGAVDGVAPTWTGVLESAKHATLARAEVVEVRPRSSRVLITGGASLADVLDATAATLSPH